MPELPEVETIRRQLAPHLEGRTLRELEVLDPRWCQPAHPEELGDAVRERRIERLSRRGKYLLVELEEEVTLVMHLRMTGNLLLRAAGSGRLADLMEVERLGAPRLYEASAEVRHLRARLRLDDGSELLFIDARRFGHGHVLAEGEIEPYFAARLGVEPLSEGLTAEGLCALAAGRRAPLKSFLLDQARIAGIGNIYADEALHRARLHPLSQAGSMRLEHCEALREGIVGALELALEKRGSSIDDYRDLRGERFDAIASIGMVEHVGAAQLDGYAAVLAGLLERGGRLLNHGIARLRHGEPEAGAFSERYVFPDAAPMHLSRVLLALERAGFECQHVEGYREHYARTLTHWAARLDANAAEGERLAGAQRMRVWRLYLRAARSGFETGFTSIYQVRCRRA